MPLILGVIVLFLYIAMFAHDRCAMEYVCQAAVAGAVYSGDDPTAAAKEYIGDNLSKRLTGRWETKINVYEDDESVTAQIEAATPLFGKAFLHTATAYKHFCPKY